jgi:hypothetical protein
VIEATVYNDPVEPRFETGIPAEAADTRKELQERILSDVEGRASIATIPQGDRVYFVLMSLKKRAQGLGLTALTSFDEVLVGLFQHHRVETLFFYKTLVEVESFPFFCEN